MRCVSYTRSSCCHPDYEPAKTIQEQDIFIQKYIKERGWKLQAEYYDDSDKEDISGFRKMKEEGIKGQFNCLIIYSTKQAGKDVFQIIRLLRNSFYPAGINFVVIEDEFCSCDHTEKAVLSFLKKKEKGYQSLTAKGKMGGYALQRHINTFGYRYDEVNNSIEIVEESAAIVREIYHMAEEGIKPGEIAKILSDRKVENPADYQSRVNGFSKQVDYNEWKYQAVFHILKNKKYYGQWGSILDKYNVTNDSGSIISKKIFDNVQRILEERCTAKGIVRKLIPNPLYNIPLRDKESQLVLNRMKYKARDKHNIQFQYPKEKDVVYEKKLIPYDEFLSMVDEAVYKEKQRFYQVKERIKSTECINLVERDIKDIQSEKEEILSDIFKTESERMTNQKKYICGNISEDDYLEKEEECNRIFDGCSNRFDRIIEQVKEVKKVYSEKNPWIALMSKYDESKDITEQKLRHYIAKIDVFRFERIEITFREQEWRDRLPQEWLEV